MVYLPPTVRQNNRFLLSVASCQTSRHDSKSSGYYCSFTLLKPSARASPALHHVHTRSFTRAASRMHAAQAHLSSLLGRLLKTWESGKRRTPSLANLVVRALYWHCPPPTELLLASGRPNPSRFCPTEWLVVGVGEPHTYSFLFLKRSLVPKQK